jgi:hypothetical protein
VGGIIRAILQGHHSDDNLAAVAEPLTEYTTARAKSSVALQTNGSDC